MSLLNFDKSESNARLVKVIGDPAIAGFKLLRNWQKRHSDAVDTLAQSLLQVTSYTNPKAEGVEYPGKFVVKSFQTPVDAQEAYTIEQELTRVTTVTSDTSLLYPLIQREKESIHPFGNGTGTGWGIVFKYQNIDPSSDTTCMVLTDSTLVARKAKAYAKPRGDSYTLVDRKTAIEDDRTASFYLLFQRKNRLAFPGANSPDFTETTNKGRSNEIRKKFWYGINRKDHASTLAAIEGAANDAGFVTLGMVEFRDDDNGAKEYTWTQIKSWTDTRTDSSSVNPQNIVHVANQTKHTEFHNFNTPQANPAITSGFKFVQSTIKKDQNTGLIEQTFIQEKATPSNAVDINGEPKTYIIVARDKGVGASDVDSVHVGVTRLADDIPTDKGPLVIERLKASDTWYVCSDIQYQDKGNGAGMVRAGKTRVNAKSMFYIEKKHVSITASDGAVLKYRQWPKVWDTYANAICTDTGLACRSFTVNGTTYASAGFVRQRHWDNTSTVTQTGLSTGSDFTPDDWKNFVSVDSYRSVEHRRTRSYDGSCKDSVRLAWNIRFYMQTTSRQKAYEFPNDNTTDAMKHYIPGGGKKHPLSSNVTPLPKGRYKAWCICQTKQAWMTDLSVWRDVGGGV